MIYEGVVVDVNDPEQNGNIKIWIPGIDGESYKIENLPWATYISPIAGQTLDYSGGSPGIHTEGYVSYGLWAIPRVGAKVAVSFFNNDKNRRIYLGSMFRLHGNRSLPTGRNREDLSQNQLSDTFDDIQPQTAFQKLQFLNQLNKSEAKTRGVFERSVAQGVVEKDGKDGYSKSQSGDYLESQTYCVTTPGRHSLIFHDNAENARVRLKTANGHQLILDDANERIYLSVAGGNSYLELDQNGMVHLYAGDSLSFSTGGDLNFSASKNINFSGAEVNLSAKSNLNFSSCETLNMVGKSINLLSDNNMSIKSSANILMNGNKIHLNGPSGSDALCAQPPSIIPSHEPWTRPAGLLIRGKHWKP